MPPQKNRPQYHLGGPTALFRCSSCRSMSTLAITFWCKIYILYFINKKRIHVDVMSMENVHFDVMSREILSMLTLYQRSRSMSTLCQGYAKEVGPCRYYVKGMSSPCRRKLPLFDVKHIFYNLLIKRESMLALCQWSLNMLTLFQGKYCACWLDVKGVGPCQCYFKGDIVHVDVMSRE